jgi:penicillin-binding protein 2
MKRKIKKYFKGLGRKKYMGIDPDEIFLDSSNLPEFDTHQFEGRIEKSISKTSLITLALLFAIIGIVYVSRVWVLQVREGEAYTTKSEKNRLRNTLVFAERGIIYDRNNKELAWNVLGEDTNFSFRKYAETSGLGHVLGYVKYPSKDSYGFYYRPDFEGFDGIEKFYNDRLRGEHGLKIVEVNALGKIQSENMIKQTKDGSTITLSIDADVQDKLYEKIKEVATDLGFVGGAGVIMDVQTGEILASTSYPEYKSQVLTDGDNADLIKSYVNSKRRIFLNRISNGTYTPGSIVKIVMAMGVLNEGVIDPNKKILSTGSISLPNQYDETKFSIFKDWKAHGWVDLRRALAVSSNVYFYEVGGGYKDQKGIGIANIEKYAKMFGLGEKTGIDLPGEVSKPIPSPAWKAVNFPNDPWRVGDTYNTVIGQYGFQVTPIQMARAVGAIANYGKVLQPSLLLGDTFSTPKVLRTLDIPKKYFDIVHEGMRDTVVSGSAPGLKFLPVEVAAKTGTAQVGRGNQYINSWVVGFFPYENPKYSFAILMEEGDLEGGAASVRVMSQLMDWMSVYVPKYIK